MNRMNKYTVSRLSIHFFFPFQELPDGSIIIPIFLFGKLYVFFIFLHRHHQCLFDCIKTSAKQRTCVCVLQRIKDHIKQLDKHFLFLLTDM